MQSLNNQPLDWLFKQCYCKGIKIILFFIKPRIVEYREQIIPISTTVKTTRQTSTKPRTEHKITTEKPKPINCPYYS